MTKTAIDAQLRAFRDKLRDVAGSRKQQIDALRAKAADAALHWVMAHESRVNQFKDAVKGTPFAGAVDKLITLLETEAAPAHGSRSKPHAGPARKSTRRAAKSAKTRTGSSTRSKTKKRSTRRTPD